MIKNTTTTALTLLVLLASSTVAAESAAEREEWRETLVEVKLGLSDGSISVDDAADRILAALAQAEGHLSPLEVAETLDRIGPLLRDPEESLRLLNRSYAIKEAEVGPRSAEVAKTLLLIASAQDSAHARKVSARREAGHAVTDEDYFRGSESFSTRHRALSIRQEVFGSSSCEAGEVQALLALHYKALGKIGKAEKMLREILTYCPPPTDENGKIDSAEHSTGFGAFASLSEILRSQGRDAELEELEAQYNW